MTKKLLDYKELIEKQKNRTPEEQQQYKELAKEYYLRAIGLGERLHKAKDFTWWEGVLTMGNARCVSFTPEDGLIFLNRDHQLIKLNAYHTPDEPDWYPDPNDPMTLGLVIDLVRSRWMNPHLSTRWDKKTQKWYIDLHEELMDDEGNPIPNYFDIIEISGPDEMDVWVQALCVDMPSEENN